MNTPTPRARWMVALLAVTLLGLAVRCIRLGAESIDLEEFACVGALDAPNVFAFLVEQRALYPYGAPLVPLLLYFLSGIAGNGILALRIFVLLFGVALIPSMYFAGVTFFRGERGRWAGLLAATCVALSPMYIYQAQEARMYAFFTLFAGLSFVALLRATREESPGWMRLHYAANLLVVSSHLFGVFLLAAQGLWLLFRWWGQWRALFRWGCINVALSLPALVWLAFAPTAGETLYSYYAPPPMIAIVNDLFSDDIVRRSSQALWASPIERSPWPEWYGTLEAIGRYADPALYWLGVIAVAGWCVRCVLRMRRTHDGGEVLLLVWYVLPLAMLVGLSYAGSPIYASRYAAYSSLALYLMFGAGLGALPGVWLRSAGLALFALLYGYQVLVALPGPTRTEWRDALVQVERESAVEAPLLVEDPFWLQVLHVNREDNGRVLEGGYKRETLCDAAWLCAQAFPGERNGAWILLLDYRGEGPEGTVNCLREKGLEVSVTRYFGDRKPYLIHATLDAAPTQQPCPYAPQVARIQKELNEPWVLDARRIVRYEPDERAGLFQRLAFAFAERAQPDAACAMLVRAAEVSEKIADDLNEIQ